METGLQPLGAPGSVMAARKYSEGCCSACTLSSPGNTARLCVKMRKNAETRENLVEEAPGPINCFWASYRKSMDSLVLPKACKSQQM